MTDLFSDLTIQFFQESSDLDANQFVVIADTDAAGATIHRVLLNAAEFPGRTFMFIRLGSNPSNLLEIFPDLLAGDTVNGLVRMSLRANREFIVLVSDGVSDWKTIARGIAARGAERWVTIEGRLWIDELGIELDFSKI